MNKIVFEHYPASKLPDDMRGRFDPDSIVKVELTVEDKTPESGRTLDEIFAARRPPFRTREEIDAALRQQRDEWDD